MSRYTEGHIAIPGWGYLALGAFVAFYAKFVQLKDPNNSPMTLFLYIGIILMLVGLGKIGFKMTIKKEVKKETTEQQKYQQQLKKQEQQWQQQQQPIAQHNIIGCPSCQARNYSNSQFCHRCGARLR